LPRPGAFISSSSSAQQQQAAAVSRGLLLVIITAGRLHVLHVAAVIIIVGSLPPVYTRACVLLKSLFILIAALYCGSAGHDELDHDECVFFFQLGTY
jgi:hypothetical protein